MTDVVITGIGLVTPLGVGVDAFWSGLMEGRSGAGPITRFDASELPVRIACEAHDFEPTSHLSPREIPRMDRYTQLAVVSAALAVENAGLEPEKLPPLRVGVIAGSGIGGLETIEQEHDNLKRGGPRRVSPFMVPKLMPNGAAGMIAMRFGFQGPNYAPASACATGAHAIGEAFRWIREGRVDVMLAGGSEAAITPLAVAAFTRMGALSRRNDDPTAASRPFDAERDGFVFGEGAAILVLESAEHARSRGAVPIARISGYAATADAFHVTQPDPEGRGAVAAMTLALEDAHRNPDEIDHINAHGTSTPYNDKTETLAIKSALGNEAKRVAIVSTKSQTGHLLGAAGAVEAAAIALAIDGGVIPATRNLENPDPECDLDYVPEGPREMPVDVALSNSFGFGGQNACLILEKP
jgi:3-oxoacyl-[acyl-carrier-protein] synthase II